MTDTAKVFRVGLIGEMGNGKTTVARNVVGVLGARIAVRIGFAEGVRQELSERYGIPIEETRTLEQKNRIIPAIGITVGQALQKIGDEGRTEDAFKWIKKLENNVATLKAENPELLLVIIDDVRYLNECEWIKSDGAGAIWKVVRPAEMKEHLFDSRDPNHASETELVAYDGHCLTIDNNRSMQRLVFTSVMAVYMLAGSTGVFESVQDVNKFAKICDNMSIALSGARRAAIEEDLKEKSTGATNAEVIPGLVEAMKESFIE
jgi:hypothetical protein